ncbi:MAG: phosphate propanoyltransferase [Elusimicrobia bacterium RIFOXYA2_FULL_39_19]|nr:MAG: phosphate propanoyltransferase [Elusimicrobia bacterium RIFOXYA2_FULL_39_19]
MTDRSKKPIMANISNRHLHVSEEDLQILFGAGSKLTNIRDLVQPGQYACKETVTIVTPKNKIENVRIIGPTRKQTQVEVSKTDSFFLGVNPPVRESGKLEASTPITLIGPKGKVDLKEGCVIAKRHVHLAPADAQELGIKDTEVVQIKVGIGTGRETIFGDVICRVKSDFAAECHLDTDEANACLLKNGDKIVIL